MTGIEKGEDATAEDDKQVECILKVVSQISIHVE